MVKISMYRGNLHKVPDVPRRWRTPEQILSLKDFKYLLHRRKRALSRISLNSNPNLNRHVKTELVTDREDAIPSERPCSSEKEKEIGANQDVVDANNRRDGFEGAQAGGGSDGGDPPGAVMEVTPKKEIDNVPQKEAANDKSDAKEAAAEEVPNEIEKQQKEVEERLQVLNTKKHNLVQMLKQILNAEEELKRRRMMQVQQQGPIMTRPSFPLHVDVSGGVETDDAANHNNAQTRTVLRLCGASSSSESPLRRAAAFSQHNMVPHLSRGSPRVVPSQPGNPNSAAAVTVSASGTNYIASSPSPAVSGGTSVFRDLRLQSPWN